MTDLDELRAWLTWATTETHVPAAERAARAPGAMPVAEAAAYLCDHAGGGEPDEQDIAWCLEHHPLAFRDLVLAWSVAAEAMGAAVPEHVPAVRPPPPADACAGCGSRPCDGSHMYCSLERYLAENPGVSERLTGVRISRDAGSVGLDALATWQPAPRPAPNWLRHMVENVQRVNAHLAATPEAERWVIGADYGREHG